MLFPNEKYTRHKQQAILLADICASNGDTDLWRKLRFCGDSLKFAFPSDGSRPVLLGADFCKDRICPLCNWRHSLKLFSQLSKVLDYCGNKFVYYFLTLTIVSKTGDKLSDQIDLLQDSWYLLSHQRKVRSMVKGFFKSLEVTYNRSKDWFHPHYHVVLACDPKQPLLDRESWLDLWRRCTGDNNITQVDFELCYTKQGSSGTSSAALEATKYSVKFSDIFFPDSPSLTYQVISVFRSNLFNRRLCSFGGVFSDARKRLKLSDYDDISPDESINATVSYVIKTFKWGLGGYKLISEDTIDRNE